MNILFVGSLETYEKLSLIFQTILKKRTVYEKYLPYEYCSKEIAKAISEPLDYQCLIYNSKDSCIRCIYTFLSKNKLVDALHGLLYLVHNYAVANSFLWRTGFHILSRIGDRNSMNEFFQAMLHNLVWDTSNMYYEYFLFLIDKREFSRVIEVYHNSVIVIERC